MSDRNRSTEKRHRRIPSIEERSHLSDPYNHDDLCGLAGGLDPPARMKDVRLG